MSKPARHLAVFFAVIVAVFTVTMVMAWPAEPAAQVTVEQGVTVRCNGSDFSGSGPLVTCAPSTTTTTAPPPTTTTTTTTPPVSNSLPVRAAFYYPWFPEAWNQSGINPFTWYTPTAGYYDGSSRAIVDRHIASMRYAGLDAGIASWWGQGTRTDGRISTLLDAADATPFKWTLYYEQEGSGDPSPTAISADLDHIAANYANRTSWLRVNGKPVLFVYGDPGDGCGTADRWQTANAGRFYLVLKVFTGYRTCVAQPNGWHQYAPAVATDSQPGYSYSISPGFWLRTEATARLARDPNAFATAVQQMAASGAPFQLVTTFNEWGEGSSIESATQWATGTGEGTYLDILKLILTGGPPPPPTDPVISAAGDIACIPSSAPSATTCRQKAVSDLLANSTAVLTLGDAQYENGELANFQQSYGPSWGRYFDKTYPSPGNHEYLTANAAGYFDYFGARAGDRTKGYYSFNVGAWHIVALNSNCSKVGGCGATSPQVAWLKADLAANPAACTLAYWHHPRFSSGQHGSSTAYTPFWDALNAAGADVVLNGHDHHYERFAPQTSAGAATTTGIRQFVVGTGGKNHYATGTPIANSEVRNSDTYGVLNLTLKATGYDWRFVPEAGRTFTDAGTGACR